ncbi:MAG: ester cyclase [Caulobacter sp.]|nr:ester cyclase [Caulobacter sp.]
MRTVLHRLRALDEAWNARRWEDYAALLDDELEIWVGGETLAHDKAAHLERARSFCAAFPDSRRHVEAYLEQFASLDGLRSASVVRVTGSARGALKLPGALPVVSTSHSFDLCLGLICRWRDGRVLAWREFFDLDLLVRQLGGGPAIPIPQGGLHDDRTQ